MSRVVVAALAGVVTLAFVVGGYSFHRHQVAEVREARLDELRAIADLKVDQIVGWREDLLNGIRSEAAVAIRPIVIRSVGSPDDPSWKNEVVAQLKQLVRIQTRGDLILASPHGRVMAASNPEHQALGPQALRALETAVGSGEGTIGELYRCPVEDSVHIDLASPIVDDRARTVAVLILRIDANERLFPLLQSWPLPSRSAETLIVRRDGDAALLLNPLRLRTAPPLSVRFPLSDTEVPAVQAVLGQTGLFEGQDYGAAAK